MLSSTLGVSITNLDIYGLYQTILADPAAFGYTNVTTPANLNPLANPDQYLFWDIPSHPTTTGHALIGQAAFSALQASAVPESSTWALGGGSLLIMFGWRARRKRGRC
jgi:phospholipase/lecithinase/hemolysin